MGTENAGSEPATTAHVIHSNIFDAKRAWQALRRACADYDADQSFESLMRAKDIQREVSQLMGVRQ